MLDSKTLVDNLTRVIINPLLALIFAAGLLVFIWGLIEFLWGLNTGGEHSQEGKMHMLYGVVGMFVMATAYTILRIIDSTIGSNVIH